MPDIFADLSWRGLIHQTTDEKRLPGWLASGGRTLYAGFDPTADSLHVGHLMAMLILRRFQRAGHRPIALVGGATGMIGDPSGRSEERNLLSVDQINANVAALEAQMRRFLDFDAAEGAALLVNNYDWMSGWGYLDFLRDIGKCFPVNVMLAKESVKNRLERTDSGLSYTEFSYMLLQAYDFVTLYKQYGCELQVGGSDQWGNITAGIDLARRMGCPQLYGMTCPLLLDAEGAKFGKTAEGTQVWLSAERTSPYRFYQYWINVADADAGICLRFLTDLAQDEIESLDQARQAAPHKRDSQHRLAEELTRLVHGDAPLAKAQRATQILFGAEIEDVSDAELDEIFADVPSKELPRGRLDEGVPVVDALAETGLAKSKSDARRRIKEGGAYVNNHRAGDEEGRLTVADLAGESTIVLRSGKKNYALLRFVDR